MKRLEDYPDAHLRIFERPTPPADPASVYLIGICGTGMGALAGLFQEAGTAVSGSDASVYPPMSTRLAAMGIPVHEGFDAAHLSPRPDVIVVGNACTPTHVEAAAAREGHLPQLSLPEAVARYFIRDRRSLVVTGTHGKTTTTSLLAHVLRENRLDPGFLVGGVMNNGGISYAVGSGSHFVIEGDEYDSAYFDKRPKFLHYRPTSAIVTSVEFDHADIYASMDAYREAFQEFARIVPAEGLLVLNGDEPEVSRLAQHARSRIRTYGLASSSVDVTATDIHTDENGQSFVPVVDGQRLDRMYLGMSGRHNLMNALAVLCVVLDEGLTPEQASAGLRTFSGIQRRQQVVGVEQNIVVVDDFAHHPTAVRATIQAARERWSTRRIVAVFEPRSNSSRRKVFEEGYTEAFSEAHAVFLSTPPFRHNDDPSNFMDIDAVLSAIQAQGIDAFKGSDADAILPMLVRYLKPGDVALIMSNGSFGGIQRRLLDALRLA
jgi:UDP-N-acetylmuramate: L-alanyl-gamma-D-glutamyl-meso-diaminopimelate ligase